jgi:GDP-mannose 6-dehydrogenase
MTRDPGGSRDFLLVPRRVVVVGLGYVGCVTAACLSRLGHEVVGVDRDELKVRAVNAARAPFYEPGLTPLVEEGVSAGRLSAIADLEHALADADVALICVGTPSERNGNTALDPLKRVCDEIAPVLRSRTRRLIVAIRSTVSPGTCEEVVAARLGSPGAVAIVDHPEFLREGSAVRDFMEPALLVIGGSDASAVREVAALYAALPVEPCFVSLRAAEMIKYACNSFHALKIAFANEIGTLCGHLRVPAHEVMDTFRRDVRLNISPAYLAPGFAFGGSCLPKDLRALTFRANRLDLRLPLLEAVLPANAAHLQRAIDAVLELPASRLGIYGLAFKENTDDLRESPVITLLEHLIGKGRDVRVYDPHINLDRIYGSNHRFLLDAIPHIGRLLVPSLDALLASCDAIVIAQKPQPSVRAELLASARPYLDLAEACPGAPVTTGATASSASR